MYVRIQTLRDRPFFPATPCSRLCLVTEPSLFPLQDTCTYHFLWMYSQLKSFWTFTYALMSFFHKCSPGISIEPLQRNSPSYIPVLFALEFLPEFSAVYYLLSYFIFFPSNELEASYHGGSHEALPYLKHAAPSCPFIYFSQSFIMWIYLSCLKPYPSLCFICNDSMNHLVTLILALTELYFESLTSFLTVL